MLFDTSLNDDVTYLLQEIGYNVKINNVDASAIINNSSVEKNFDDKKIITNTKLTRGMYIQTAEKIVEKNNTITENKLNFIVLNEINSRRYRNYYKAIMRNCNFDIKFIVEEKLYLFYAIVESENFAIENTQFLNMSADTISVTLPLTAITEKIDVGDRFCSTGRFWKIKGIDLTKKGLVKLISKVDEYSSVEDDIENEIANRYDKSNIDVLKGNITSIMPFQAPEPEEPIDPEPEEPEEIEITGESEISLYDEDIEYSINTDKDVEWSLSRLDLVKITKIEGNKCYIDSGNNNKNIGIFELIATVDGEVYKKEIELVYM